MKQIKPGNFGNSVSTDSCRMQFDFGNEQLLYTGVPIDYLFIGDSITALWEQQVYLGTGCRIVNRGIGGDCSTYLLKRFDADCVQLKPKTAILMIGTNDISRCHDDLWWHVKGQEESVVLEEYQHNIRQMIAKCDANGIHLVLCSVLPSTIAPPFDREMRWRMTDAMNAFLQSTGKPYVDYFHALTEDGKNLPADLSPDGIHPNAKAYAIMATVLKKTLSPWINEEEIK